jgi:hypothetical protein
MKLEKLLTLSQFVDEIKKTYHYDGAMARIKLIFDYNEFLKTPLKKEMFVNPIEQKWEKVEGREIMVHDSHYDKWQEAEKKVIFENSAILEMSFDWASIKIIYPDLNSLAEAHNGQLKLKNVEI